MTQLEFRKECRKHLYSYAADKLDVAAWEDEQYGISGVAYDKIGGAPQGVNSDPTMRKAIAVAEPPPDIRRKREWIEAIQGARQEVAMLDQGHDFGMTYVMNQLYGLNRFVKRSKRERQSRMERIQKDCHISRRTMYLWLARITDIVMYHAACHGLAGK